MNHAEFGHVHLLNKFDPQNMNFKRQMVDVNLLWWSSLLSSRMMNVNGCLCSRNKHVHIVR